jgi:glycerol-3-phosphate acyltransferase PlsX
MRIGIDIMGGDFAPEAAVLGSFLARNKIPAGVELVLFGHKESITRIAGDNGFSVNGLEIIPTTEVISMCDNPYKAFISKKESGIVKGFKALKTGEIDGFCSAGNTGAMMIGASQVINVIPGVIRPAIAARLPNTNGHDALLLDVGLNPDSRPDVLYQYGILGKSYAQSIYKIQDPRVGLVNIGSEEEKGNLTVKSTYQLMKDCNDYNFVGNIEANNFFTDPGAEVMVCDGFIGNIILKEAEGLYKLLKKRNIEDEFFEKFNFENFGGTPILGINKPVVVGHGISNDVAIKNMILHTLEVVQNNLITNIKVAIE